MVNDVKCEKEKCPNTLGPKNENKNKKHIQNQDKWQRRKLGQRTIKPDYTQRKGVN